MHTEILLFDGFDELDAIAPYEVLAGAGERVGWTVRLVTPERPRTVTAGHGTRVQAHAALSPAPELLLVPGGGWNDRRATGVRSECERGELPRAIAARHAAGTAVASVCTGAMLLAAAGLVRGRPATTHHSALADLRAAGAEVPAGARVVDDGDLLSAGGVTSGLDLALWILERRLGARVAAAAARELEYERRGPVWCAGRLQEVVPGEHVHEGHDRDQGGDAPGQLGHAAHVAASEQVDPDQHDGDRVQDATDDLEELLHRTASLRASGER